MFRYSKDEAFLLTVENEHVSPYSFAITEAPCPDNLRYYQVQSTIKGLARVSVERKFPFVNVVLEDKLCVLKNIKDEIFDDNS